MRTREVEVKCSRCDKPMKLTIPDQPGEQCPPEWMDSLSKILTCMDCLVKYGRVSVEKPKQQFLPKVMPPPEPAGLPYKDE